jgi:ATP-dependent Lhr-like helicase
VRSEFAWLTAGTSVVNSSQDSETAWWTFAGARANASLAPALAGLTRSGVTHDSFSLKFERQVPLPTIEEAIQEIRSQETGQLIPSIDEAALDGLKFSECLPRDLGMHVLQMRARDEAALKSILSQPAHFVSR